MASSAPHETTTDELKHQLASAITGVESPVSSSEGNNSLVDDDITPFPSPALKSLSCMCSCHGWPVVA
jgi:hypothetical protein